jgi:fumarate reductase flavoprotein subunit
LQVLVIEKTNCIGGTLEITAGHLSAANTQQQQNKGIIDSVESHYSDIVKISRNTMHAALTRKAVALAPATLAWLSELGYPFHEKSPAIFHGHEPYSVARTYFGKDDVPQKLNTPGQSVLRTLLPQWNSLVRSGKIKVLLEHSFLSFIKKENTIESILVKHNEEEKKLKAKHYVLTTGGYASNPAFFNKVTNNSTRLISTANLASTGDGTQAAIEIGAVFSGAEKHSSTLGALELEPNSGRANFWGAFARVSNNIDRKQREIYVNDDGIRFMNEYDTTADERERAVLEQPNKRFWIIFDSNALVDGLSLIPQWSIDEIIEESKKEKALWQANTVEDLAAKTKLPLDNLQKTISSYNQFVEVQLDSFFGRTYLAHNIIKPPYFAVLVYAYSLISFGGIRVNENLQVVCQDGNYIDNLYAAGEVLGAAATSGNAFCSGMLLTPALSFGKWLGETIS